MQTLVEPTEHTSDASAAALSQAKDDALAARADEDGKEAAVESATDALQAATAALASLKALLCASQMPADATAAAGQLEVAIQTARTAQADLTKAELALAASTAMEASAESKLALATAQAAEADADAKAAAKDDDAHASWTKSLGKPPLSTLAADVAEARQKQGAAALEHLEAAIPAALLEPALARGRAELARRAALADAAQKAAKAVAGKEAAGGESAAAKEAERVYRASEATLLAFVQTAASRLQAAIATLDAVAASPPLTDAELARIREVGGGEAPAAPTGQAGEEGYAEGASPEQTADPAQPPDGGKPGGKAKGQQAAADPGTNRAWLATIPDSTFEQLAAYVAADAELELLQGTKPDALIKAVDDAAKALTTARSAEAGAAVAAWQLGDAADRAAALLAAEAGHEDTRLLSAVRGDG